MKTPDIKLKSLAAALASAAFAALAVLPASATEWKFYLKGATGNPTNVTCITDGNWILQSGNSSALDATKPIIIGANNSLCVKAGSGVLDLRDLTVDGVVRQIHIGGWQGQNSYVFNGAGTITEFYANNVAYLGALATFSTCKGLTTVSISGSFDKVPASCFNLCSSLTNVVLDSPNLATISASAFQESKKLTAIEITTEKAVTVASTAVQYNNALTSLTIGGPVWTTANVDNLLLKNDASAGAKKCTIYADSEKWLSLASSVTTAEKAYMPKKCFGVYREDLRKAWLVASNDDPRGFMLIIR